MTAWLLYSLVLSGLCVLAARSGEAALRAQGRPVRWAWVAGLFLALVLTGLALVRSPAPAVSTPSIPALDETAAGATTAEPPGVRALALDVVRDALALPGDLIGGALAAVQAATSAHADTVDAALVALWIGASTVLVLLLIGALRRLGRARASWRRDHIAGTPVLVSAHEGPALVGLLRPTIVVPEWLLREPQERQELVVRHEREHALARDHLVLLLGCAAVCAMPWNPASWWMLRRLRLAIELDCDARVLRSGAQRRSYGMLLLDIAGHASTSRPFIAPALVDARTHLERRVLAMTETNRTRRPLRTLSAAAAALLLSAAACTTDMPTAAQIDEMDVETARTRAAEAGLVDLSSADGPVYVVDGVVVTEAQARALAPEQIEAIEVLKGTAARNVYGYAASAGAVMVRTRSKTPLEEVVVEGQPLPVRTRESEGRTRVLHPTTVEGAPAGEYRTALRAPAGELQLRERKPAPLIEIDGVLMGLGFGMEQIEESSIERIEVVKGAAAQRLYSDPRAVNGVIRITTKR
jgi:bla regulator protein BlaR1